MPMASFATAYFQQRLKSKSKSKSTSKAKTKTAAAAAAAAAEEEIDEDPDYKLFLKHLHPNGTGRSYFLDMISTSTHTPRRGKEKEKRGGGGGATTSTNSIYIRYEDESSFYNKENDDEMSSLANWTAMLDPRNPSVDRDYRDFLKHLKPQPDGSVLLHLDNDVLIHYPEEEAAADPEEEEAAADPQEEEQEDGGKETLARNEDYKQKISSSSPSLGKDLQSHNPSPRLSKFSGSEALSSFESRLMKNLNRPFDQREYNRLMRSATVRKPMVKLKHLRTVDVPYETDFARKVSSADHLRGLKLLRGFFFWLMNLDHEGAYRPWVSTP